MANRWNKKKSQQNFVWQCTTTNKALCGITNDGVQYPLTIPTHNTHSQFPLTIPLAWRLTCFTTAGTFSKIREYEQIYINPGTSIDLLVSTVSWEQRNERLLRQDRSRCVVWKPWLRKVLEVNSQLHTGTRATSRAPTTVPQPGAWCVKAAGKRTLKTV